MLKCAVYLHYYILTIIFLFIFYLVCINPWYLVISHWLQMSTLTLSLLFLSQTTSLTSDDIGLLHIFFYNKGHYYITALFSFTILVWEWIALGLSIHNTVSHLSSLLLSITLYLLIPNWTKLHYISINT